jgi:hypothetical protein
MCEPNPITVSAKLVKTLSGMTCWEVWRLSIKEPMRECKSGS